MIFLRSEGKEGLLDGPNSPNNTKSPLQDPKRSNSQPSSAVRPVRTPLRPAEQSLPRSRPPHRDPRHRSASPPHSRVADLPSGERTNFASLEAIPQQTELVTHLLTHRRTEALNANHSTAERGSDGVRPLCRTAAVTGVQSTNSGHCSAIPSTAAALWEPATLCTDVPGTAPATVLPTPRTFSAAEPSDGMGATLERGLDLDRSKTPSCRTLDALPRHAWRTVPFIVIATTPTGATRTPARSPRG